MKEEVTFNGVTISDFYQIASVQRPMPSRRLLTTDVSGMDGMRIVSSSMSNLSITVSIVVDGDAEDRRDAIRTLTPLLHTDEPQPLFFSSDNGLYYVAMLNENVSFTEHVRSGIVDVNFVTETPVLYGEERQVTVPSGGSVSILVDGTYPTRPIISGTVTGNQSTHLWGITQDSGRHMYMDMGSTQSKAVVMDCEDRTATLAGAVSLPTLDSDWFEFVPGSHTLANTTGTGACTVRWQEMWI